MMPLPLPTQTLAWLTHAEQAGQRDAQVLLHLLNRADANDQDVARFLNSYNATIAALCRRLEALERGVNDLPAPATPPAPETPAEALPPLPAHIQISYQPKTMTTHDIRAAAAAPEPGENLATPPTPEGVGGPTLADVDELCAEFGFHCDDSDSLEMLRDMIAAALARWVHTPAAAPAPGENLATPSAPPPQTPPIDEAWWHELINEIARVQYVAAGEGQGGRFDLAKAVELWCCRATSLAPVAELDDRQREAVHQAVAEALGSGAYDCTRVWSAWSYGTMGPDDFAPVAEDSDRVAEIADAAIRAISTPALAPVAECPNCGYEGEMAPAPQAGKVGP